MRSLSLLLALAVAPVVAQNPENSLVTVAESSKFKATARHADVMSFLGSLAKKSPCVVVGEMGKSFEGRAPHCSSWRTPQ